MMSFPVLLWGQRVKNISLSFDNNKFRTYMENGCEYIKSDAYDFSYGNNPNEPAIPFVTVNVLIGPNEELDDFSFSKIDSVFMTNVLLGPNPVIFSMDQPYYHVDSVIVNYVDSIYPSEDCRFMGKMTIGGYKILTFKIPVFKYLADDRVLTITSICNLDLTLHDIEPSAPQELNREMSSLVNDLVVNSEDISTLYNFGPVYTNPSNEIINYLIITRDSLKNAFDNLVRWKTQKGLRAKVLTVEDILSNPNYTGDDVPLKIKQAIKYYYDNYQTRYVLLGGNNQQVPSRLCYIRFARYNYYGQFIDDYDYTPADCFYSDLQTMDWNSDNDYRQGEIEDNIDLGCSVLVGRLPINKFNQAKNVADRIVNYEKGEGKEGWEDIFLLAGKLLYGHDHFGRSDAQNESERMYSEYIAPYWNGNAFRLFDTMTDYPEGADYGYTADHLQQELMKGYSFVNVNSHGDYSSWDTNDSTNYSLAYASSLINPKNNMIITTSACNTNGFDNSCISRSLFCNVNSGIIAYLGSSRSAWTIDTPNFCGCFSNHLFNCPGHPLGLLMQSAKQQCFADLYTYGSTNRWLYMSINLMGDPSMKLYPQVSSIKEFKDLDVDVSYGNDHMLSVYTLDSCDICVSSSFDNGQQFYVYENNCGYVSAQSTANNCFLCISKKNHIPYLCSLYLINKIQNTTMSGNSRILNNSRIEIGRNVECHLQEGPVVIDSGRTIVKSPGGVFIKNGFKVNKGASFVVNSQ